MFPILYCYVVLHYIISYWCVTPLYHICQTVSILLSFPSADLDTDDVVAQGASLRHPRPRSFCSPMGGVQRRSDFSAEPADSPSLKACAEERRRVIESVRGYPRNSHQPSGIWFLRTAMSQGPRNLSITWKNKPNINDTVTSSIEKP